MAFETLSEKFSALFKKMRKEDKLTEANVESAIREIRIALLEADVNFKVVKAFTEDVREKALGQEVLLKVNPSQQFIKICHDELVTLLGQDNSQIKYQNGLTIIMLVGLQGSGKTTSAGKLANLLKNKLSKKPLLCIDTDKVHIKLLSEYALYLIAFILAEKSVINEYTGKLLSYCLMHK